jgi:hypothetical protein
MLRIRSAPAALLVGLMVGPLLGLRATVPPRPTAIAQVGEIDRGILLITRGTTVVGREEFVVRRGRGAGTLGGFTVASTVWYPPDRPTRSLTSVVEYGADSLPTAARVEATNGDLRRVLISMSPRRVTVRVATADGETAREHPARTPHLFVDDSVFATHALPPARGPGAVRAMTLAGTRGSMMEVVDHGMDATQVGRATRQLRHITLRTDEGVRHLWYSPDGRLWKVADPGRRLVATRVANEDAR